MQGRPKGGNNNYYSKEEKLKYVNQMLEGKSCWEIEREVGINHSVTNRWLKRYLEDTPFYNERDYVEGVVFPIAYAQRQRIWGTKTDNYEDIIQNTTIKLGDINIEDIFTVSNEIEIVH